MYPADEWALRKYLDSSLPHLIQGVLDQDRRKPPTTERRIDLGMDEGVSIALRAIRSEAGQDAIDPDSKSVLIRCILDRNLGVIGWLSHHREPFVGGWQP